MAFITKSAYIEFCNLIDINVDKEELLKLFHKYIIEDDRFFKLFNKIEITNLLKQIVLLLDDEEIKEFQITYKTHNYVSREDNLKYIIPINKKLSYHLSKECERLNAGFINFNTPEDFFNLPNSEEAINDLRIWFAQNNFTPERFKNGEFSIDIVVARYNMYFPKKYGIKSLNESYKLLEEKKSLGVVGTKVPVIFDLQSTLEKLGNIIAERYYLCNFEKSHVLAQYSYLHEKSDNEIKEKLKDLGLMDKIYEKRDIIHFLGISTKGYDENKALTIIKNFLKRNHELKKKAFEILSNYIRYKYNSDNKEFEPNFLEEHGFTLCKTCLANKFFAE